jgi:purine-cytosine permease-like protein
VIAPPSQPIPTTRLADDEPGLVDEHPESHPALLIEAAGPEPTPLDLRAGRAARMFWLWFAANSSVVSLTLGAVLFGMGMSLRQALVAIFLGVALSCLPLGLVTLAGKWSGQPTMIVSRATFGIAGNGLPAVLALVSRVFWGGALLWVLATGVAAVVVDAGLDAGLGEQVWTLVGLGAGFALAFVVAIFGYGLIARVQLVLSILTGLLVVGVVLLTFPRLDLAAAQSVADGPWMLLVTGVVLVFSFVGLAWVHSGADLARYQRTDSDGGATALWGVFGATLPALILVAWGALLAASDPLIADGLATNPLYTIAALLPLWYPAPLIAALSLGLISGVVLTIYSGGFALQSLGVAARRSATTAVAGVLVLGVGAVLIFMVGDARDLIVDVATTIAVPVAAWAGIFGAEVIIRRRRFDTASLLRSGGVYPTVRWPNLIGLVVISAVGFGLTSAALPGLGWQGYLLPFLGLADGDPLATSDVGVLVALLLGMLLPLATAWRAIRRQEAADQAPLTESMRS